MSNSILIKEDHWLGSVGSLKTLSLSLRASLRGVVALVSEVTQTPVALLSMPDGEGLSFSVDGGTNPFDIVSDKSFYSQTILGDELLIVENTLQDSRFVESPVVTEAEVRFYAGTPVILNGRPVATLGCLDKLPRTLTEAQKLALKSLARQAGTLFEAQEVIERLSQSESRFSQAIAGMNDGLVVYDKSGNLTLANPAALRVFGVPEQEIANAWSRLKITTEDGRIWPIDGLPHLVALRDRVEQVGLVVGIEKPNGARTWALTSAVPIFRSGDDGAQGVITTVVDITEKRETRLELVEQKAILEEKLEENIAELGLFFTASMDLLCITNTDGEFIRLSPSFSTSLGYTINELMLRPVLDFIHPDDHEFATIAGTSKKVSMAEPVQYENRWAHRDGSWRTLWWKSVQMSNGYIYSAGRDITEQRATEAELRIAVEDARKANLAKSEFLSRMSHELRTPMNAVLGYAQLLDLKYKDAGIKEATSSIIKGGRHLLQLINEVLDLSRIEAGNLGISIEAVDVSAIIEQTFELLQPAANESGIELNLNLTSCMSVHVQADAQRLLQVILNLVSNGIKYNRTGGSVTVSCHPQGDRCRILVRDTGFGIKREDQSLLFQPFQRFGDPGITGSGLGLAISERFASLMGGSLKLANSTSEGTTFFIDLLRADPKLPEHLEISNSSLKGLGSDASGTVLYIEDNLSNIRLLESVLADWPNCTLIPALQGTIGIELARQHSPHLILLDIHLPDLMGDKVLAKLKQDELTKDIPVVILSADATKRQIDESAKLGAVDYLTKPIDLEKLYQVLDRYLVK